MLVMEVDHLFFYVALDARRLDRQDYNVDGAQVQKLDCCEVFQEVMIVRRWRGGGGGGVGGGGGGRVSVDDDAFLATPTVL